DVSALPPLDEIDPEGAYLTWKINLSTDADEKSVREIFEFVEFDCDLSIDVDLVGMDEESAAQTVEAILAQVAAEEAAQPQAGPAPVEPAPVQIEPQAAPEPAPTAPVAANQQSQPAAQAAQHPGATIRVDLDRVDRLIDL